MESFETFAQINNLCKRMLENNSDISALKELQECVKESSPSFIRVVQKLVIGIFHPFMKNIANNNLSFRSDEKQVIIDTLKTVLDKVVIDNNVLFFNFYLFLVHQIYDYGEHKVLQTSEEYKMSILECMISLFKSTSSDLVVSLYVKENVPNFSQIIYVASELSKNEKSKDLRCCAIKCIMTVAHVMEDDDFNNVVLRDQIAEVFIFFLPGLSGTLTKIAIEDEKIGHKVLMCVIKAFGRIITLIMQDYNRLLDDPFDLNKFLSNVTEIKSVPFTPSKFKNKEEIDNYIGATKRTHQWYKDNDQNLSNYFIKLQKLVNHPHINVTKELVTMADLLISNCITTAPLCISHIIEIVIVLCEHENKEVSENCQEMLRGLSKKLSEKSVKQLMETMEERFYNAVMSLPRKFNLLGIGEKTAALDLLIGYINLFGEHNLHSVLLNIPYLEQLMSNLLYISDLDSTNIELLEEYTIRELSGEITRKTPWKKFKHFDDNTIELKIGKLCRLLANLGAFHVISDFLLDTILYKVEHKNEAIFLLNELIGGITYSNYQHIQLLKNIVSTYVDPDQWPKTLSINSESAPNEIKNSIIQSCLLVEGIGRIALVTKREFQKFLLQTLYLVIERAGSKNSLVSTAGLGSLVDITNALGYKTIEDLVSNNIDYFSYHVERRLNRLNENDSVLDVFVVVLRYSKIDVVQTVDDVVNEVLMRSCDRFNQDKIAAFLQIFKMFIKCLHRWLNIQIKEEPIKSKAEKIKEIEEYKVSGIDYSQDFSDDVMETKSAEDMYKEDMLKKKQSEEENENGNYEMKEIKKPEPPAHIKLTVAILTRSLHFLPSKDKNIKLLVLEVLMSGVEVLREYEDELLPVVHKIWSPLVQRFKEFDEPVVINYSFQLLVTLARLSKEFIRMRTTKEALPNIFLILKNMSKESYLKDKGSAYRYTQAYKLQLQILENLAKILIYLDVQDKVFDEAMEHAFYYLSEKQPIPLQTVSLEFFKQLATYDRDMVSKKLDELSQQNEESEYTKLLGKLSEIVN